MRGFVLLTVTGIVAVWPPARRESSELHAAADSLLAISRSAAPSRVWPDLSDSTRLAAARRLDAVATQLGRIDRRSLTTAGDELLYDNLSETVAGTIGTRICRYELWSGTNQFGGWHVTASNWARSQRMETDAERARAFDVLNALPAAIDAERGMLRRGLDSGYTASSSVILTVVKQLGELLPDDVTRSPLWP